MWRFLENIRQKPKGVRNLYAFWGACFFTLVVVVIWSLSVPGRLLAILSPTEPEVTPSGRLWSGIVERGTNLSASVIGVFVKEDDTETIKNKPAPAVKKETASEETAPAKEEENWVWSRPYEEREGGQVVQIATSSSQSEVEARP